MVRLCTVNLLLCSTYVVIAEDDKVSENGDLEEAESIENVAVTDEETQPKEFDSSVSADLKKATVEMAPVRQCYSAVVIHHKSLTKRDVKGPTHRLIRMAARVRTEEEVLDIFKRLPMEMAV